MVKSFPESGFSPIDITLTSNITVGTTISVNNDSWYDSNYIFTLYTDPYDSYSVNHAFNKVDYGVPLLIGQVSSVSSNTVTVPAMAASHTGVGYTSGSKIYVTVKLATESSKNFYPQILGNNTQSFPIINLTEVDNEDGILNHNYNKTMALVDVGDGNTNDAAFEDGSSNDVDEENRFPLDVDTTETAGTLHDVNGIVKLPYIAGSVTEGNQFDYEAPYDTTQGPVQHMFRWNFDANFNGAVMTIANGKALEIFNSDGSSKLTKIGWGSAENVFQLVVGSDSSYNKTFLRLTGVTDTQLTFSTNAASAVSPGWTNSDETNCTLTAYQSTVSTLVKVNSLQRLFPIRAIQDAKSGKAFAFKNMSTVILDIPVYSGNTGSNI